MDQIHSPERVSLDLLGKHVQGNMTARSVVRTMVSPFSLELLGKNSDVQK